MRIREIVGLIAAVLSIISFCFSIYCYITVDRFEKMIIEFVLLEMDVSLTEPLDKAPVSNHVIDINGQIRIKLPSPTTDINLDLARRNIDVVPMVRPLSETNLWFVQTRPNIHKDGSFQGSVNIGDKEGRGIGVNFQIVVIAVPKGTIKQGQTFSDLPRGATSKTITVRRIR